MIHITNWLVHSYCLLLQFLTSKLVICLILEHACLSYASQSEINVGDALDQAYSRYCTSGIHEKVIQQLHEPPAQYSIVQLTDFILMHHLWWLCFATSCYDQDCQRFSCSYDQFDCLWFMITFFTLLAVPAYCTIGLCTYDIVIENRESCQRTNMYSVWCCIL